MPTRGRRQYAREAVAAFLLQSYPFKELLILDDQDDPSFPNGLEDIRSLPGWHGSVAMITYRALPIRYNIPTKRNMLCGDANGEIIWHLDSDDVSAPGRMTDQVERLVKSGKSLTGYSSMLFKDEATGKFYRYGRREPYALGTSLCFTKAFWQKHPFKESHPVGSDNLMFYAARDANDFIVVPGEDMMYARIHTENTSQKYPARDPHNYKPVEAPQFEAINT